MTERARDIYRDCVLRSKLPLKFRNQLKPLGVVFDVETEHDGEELVTVKLPPGWRLVADGELLELRNKYDNVILATYIFFEKTDKCVWHEMVD